MEVLKGKDKLTQHSPAGTLSRYHYASNITWRPMGEIEKKTP